MFDYTIAFGFISGLMVVGAWLETIGEKHGFIDELLTPLPLGAAGLIVCLVKGGAWA
jgi:hypothetical protein